MTKPSVLFVFYVYSNTSHTEVHVREWTIDQLHSIVDPLGASLSHSQACDGLFAHKDVK